MTLICWIEPRPQHLLIISATSFNNNVLRTVVHFIYVHQDLLNLFVILMQRFFRSSENKTVYIVNTDEYRWNFFFIHFGSYGCICTLTFHMQFDHLTVNRKQDNELYSNWQYTHYTNSVVCVVLWRSAVICGCRCN